MRVIAALGELDLEHIFRESSEWSIVRWLSSQVKSNPSSVEVITSTRAVSFLLLAAIPLYSSVAEATTVIIQYTSDATSTVSSVLPRPAVVVGLLKYPSPNP